MYVLSTNKSRLGFLFQWKISYYEKILYRVNVDSILVYNEWLGLFSYKNVHQQIRDTENPKNILFGAVFFITFNN